MRKWKNRIRRIFSLALTAVLLGSAADLSVFAVSVVSAFSTVKIGGVDVSSASETTTVNFGEGKGAAVWDPASAVLTLDNVSISQNNIAILTGTFDPVPITVNLEGINEIDITQCAEGTALTTGDSVLTINGEEGAELKIKGMSEGQNAIQGKSVRINSGTITAEVNGSAIFVGDEVNIAGGTLDLKSTNHQAVFGTSAVNITGGKITAEAMASSAIYAWNGNVCISGSETEVHGKAGNGNAVYGSGEVNIEGGILELESDLNSYPAVYGGSAVNITGGKTAAKSKVGSAIHSDGNVHISGDKTEVTAEGYVCALFFKGEMKISGARVRAYSETDHVVYTNVGPITIGDNADVTLSSNCAMATGLFLNNEEPLTITDSAVDIATDGTGMYSKTNVSITDSQIELNCPNGNGIVAHNGKLSMGGERGRICCKSLSPLYGAEVEISGGYVDMTSSEGPAISGMKGISVNEAKVHAKAVGTRPGKKPAAFYSSQGNVTFTGEAAQVEAVSESFRAVYTDNAANGKIILDAKVSAKAGEDYEVFKAYSNGTDNTSDPEPGIIIGEGYSAQGYCPVTTKWKGTSQGSSQYFAYTVLAPFGTENLQEDYFQDLPNSADIVAAASGVSADQVRIDFGGSPYGEDVPQAQTIRITNTGNTIFTLVPPTANHYTVTTEATDSGLTLVPGKTADFTIQPKPGFTPGEYGETITFSTDKEGVEAQIQAVFTVSQAELTVTAAAAEDRTYDGTREVRITGVDLAGIKNGDDVSVETAGLRGSVSGSDAGTYHEVLLPAITLTGADAENYLLVQPQGAVTASPAIQIHKGDTQLVTEKEEYSKVYGDAPFALEVRDNNTEADPRYEVTEGADIVSVEEGTVTMKKAGTAVITVSLPESKNYNAAADKKITVKVEKKGGYTAEAVHRKYSYTKEHTDTVDLQALLPPDCGTAVYGTPVTSGNAVYIEAPALKDGKLTYRLNRGNIGDEGIITLGVTTENYKDFIVTVTAELVDPIPVYLKTGTEVTLKNSVLTYGETLSRLEFDQAEFVDGKGNAVKGVLGWKESTDRPEAGITRVPWVFTPEDTGYLPVEGTAEITVNKGVPYIARLPEAGEVTYGESLEASGLSGGRAQHGNGAGEAGTGEEAAVEVEGTFTWEDPTIKPGVADSGKREYTVLFTPSDGKNYDSVRVKVTLMVSRAELTVTGAAAEDRTYDGTREVRITGVALAGIKNGDDVSVETAGLRGSVSGPDAGTYHEVLLPAMALTGRDAGNYLLVQPQEAVTVSPVIQIRKGTPELVTEKEEYSKVYGDAPFALEVRDNNTEADPRYDVTEGADIVSVEEGIVTIKKAGSAVITVSLPESKNYNAAADKKITVKVEKKGGYTAEAVHRKYTYTKEHTDTVDLQALLPPDCGTAVYGTPVTSGRAVYIEAPALKDGKLTYRLNSGNIGDEGVITLGVTTENYKDFTVTVNVELTGQIPIYLKTGTEVTLKNSALIYGETLTRLEFDQAEFVDSEGNAVKGVLGWKEGTGRMEAGITNAPWVFTPEDAEYLSVEGTAEITVNKAVPYIARLPEAGEVTYGESLEASGLSGGRAQHGNGAGEAGAGENAAVEVEGTFTWEDPSIKPGAADSGKRSYTVLFTPSDGKNYDSVRVKVALIVNKAKNPPNMPKKTMTASQSCKKVGDVTLPEGWQWDPAYRDKALEAGKTVKAAAVYGGADKGNYENETVIIAVTKKSQSHETAKEKREGNEFILNAGLKADQTGKKINVTWGKVPGAQGYDVYVQYCGSKYSNKSVNEVRGGQKTKIAVKKVNGKKLDTKKNIRIYVAAYKMENGKKITLAKSITAHIAGKDNKKYTNVKAISVKKNSYRLKKGRTAQIQAKILLADKRKRELPDSHAQRFRYASSDEKVAAVTENGKIKGVGKGTCNIHVYARNGCAKKIKVTVQ